MGIRRYFRSIPKKEFNEIQACETNEAFIEWAKSRHIDILPPEDQDDADKSPIVDMFGFGEKVYCFGSGDQFLINRQSMNESLFSSQILAEKYNDYKPVVCSQFDFLDIINNYRKLIVDHYNKLMDDEYEDPDGNLTPDERRKFHIEMIRREWSDDNRLPINTDSDNACIADSWMYEYAIFELVYLYKTFDWANNKLILIKY